MGLKGSKFYSTVLREGAKFIGLQQGQPGGGGLRVFGRKEMTGQTLFLKKKMTAETHFWAKNDGATTFLQKKNDEAKTFLE